VGSEMSTLDEKGTQRDGELRDSVLGQESDHNQSLMEMRN